jgi:DNA replication regulator DPB11
LWLAVTFRAQLQEAVSANGGEYHGDLTKDVTHLIACAPEGKKYQYATQWEIKIVSLEWLKDSLERRMILEETLYHPTIPKGKVGQGAWNRKNRVAVQLGKRNRDEEAVPDVPRKLRRTASVKLGSQSESLWSEIVSGPQGGDLTNGRQLRPSKSLPTLHPADLEPESFATDLTAKGDDGSKSITRASAAIAQQRSRRGIFSDLGFFFYAFTSKQVMQATYFVARQCFADTLSRLPSCEITYSVMTERYLRH